MTNIVWYLHFSQESKFRETGVLTPEEVAYSSISTFILSHFKIYCSCLQFVAAGEHLVHHCPTWKWQSGDKTKAKDFLPNEKQFLVTKNGNFKSSLYFLILHIFLYAVPCFKRYKDVESMKFHEYLIDENDGEGGWVDTHYFNDPKEVDEEVTLGEEAKEVEPLAQSAQTTTATVDAEDDDSEAEDIESFMNEGLDDENDEVS